MVTKLTDATFRGAIDSNRTLVIRFYADWCGACKQFAPVFEKVSGEVKGAVFSAVNVDENPNCSSTLQIKSLPTTLVIQNHKIIDILVGSNTPDNFKAFLRKHGIA